MDLFEIANVNKQVIDDEIYNIITEDELLSYDQKQFILDLTINQGKKLRPLFTIIGSYFGNKEVAHIYKYASIFELVHTATLIHDDVIDHAETRRGIPSLHITTDKYTAIMLGNYVMSMCAELISKYNIEEDYYSYMSLTDLCHSEIMQQDFLYNFDVSLKEYIEKTKNKTALLIAASLISGASIAGADKRTLKHLYHYSINLGISFQIIDDILDFTQGESELGKPAGQDLLNGNITLPVIYALKNKKISSKIRELSENSSESEFKSCIDLIQDSKALDRSKKLNKKYQQKAKRALRKIKHPDTKILKELLLQLEKRSS
ncbi:polyprenyl synthetase family protein [Haloplasma contractile]|uniref:Heptaprenyl diphosphate synthase component 2 protein n=1 Tax=Haloplasma contractile SSD-17B TaxID=1033810 RepID=F7PSZ8_9MOLU|nr:polyprenyl synthetase family protein [Haloplasma contractile]ERJ12590.1 Heptaprenyl diphosphate synthase component 2 protein [Haloplasma contractile SSD-17B]